jgi:hypothetical protein
MPWEIMGYIYIIYIYNMYVYIYILENIWDDFLMCHIAMER